MDACRSTELFVRQLAREMLIYNDMDLSSVELDDLQRLFKESADYHPGFEVDVSKVVQSHNEDETASYCSPGVLRVLCHAMMIGAKSRESGLLLRMLSTVIQNGCSTDRIGVLLEALNESSTENYLAAYLSANFNDAGCVSSIVRIYQNLYSFLLTNFDPEVVLKRRNGCLMLPLGLVAVFAKVMEHFNVYRMHSNSLAPTDMDEACAVWNVIVRVLNTAVEYYERVVDACATELENFRGLNFAYFDETRARAEKVLAIMDHIGDELVNKIVRRLRNIIVIDDSDSVLAMMSQVKVYAEEILKHYETDTKHAQRTLKNRLCRIVADIGDVYV